MRSAASAGDDHLDSASLGGGGKLRKPHRRAMGRDDMAFVRYAKLFQHLDRMLHGLPVGRRAHHNGD
jgi:hypothetical protein